MANQPMPTIYSNKPEPLKEKKIEPVVNSCDYVIKKRSLRKKILDIFFNGDIREVKEYLMRDVLVPAVRDTIFDIGQNGLYMLLYNTVRGVESRKGGGTYISYNNKYSNAETRRERSRYDTRDAVRKIDDIIFYERGKADLVLEEIFALYEEYHVVSKADVLQIISDKDENFKYVGDFTDNNWGWDDLSGARVDRVRGGYWLNLPPMKHI